jgi:hypothetical protein
MTTSKGGRRKNQVIGNDGKVVDGLSFDSGSKSYFHRYKEAGTWQKLNLGRDKATAIFKLTQWLFKNHESYGTIDRSKLKNAIKIKLDPAAVYKKGEDREEFKKRLTEWAKEMRQGKSQSEIIPITHIPDSYVYARARQLILINKVESAKQIGIPEIATFDTMKYQIPPTLNESSKSNYLNSRNWKKVRLKLLGSVSARLFLLSVLMS